MSDNRERLRRGHIRHVLLLLVVLGAIVIMAVVVVRKRDREHAGMVIVVRRVVCVDAPGGGGGDGGHVKGLGEEQGGVVGSVERVGGEGIGGDEGGGGVLRSGWVVHGRRGGGGMCSEDVVGCWGRRAARCGDRGGIRATRNGGVASSGVRWNGGGGSVGRVRLLVLLLQVVLEVLMLVWGQGSSWRRSCRRRHSGGICGGLHSGGGAEAGALGAVDGA